MAGVTVRFEHTEDGAREARRLKARLDASPRLRVLFVHPTEEDDFYMVLVGR